MKYLIIEDEKAAARNLKAMLEQLAPDMELIDVLDSVADTIDWFGCHAMPELVFMDIHLADGSPRIAYQKLGIRQSLRE